MCTHDTFQIIRQEVSGMFGKNNRRRVRNASFGLCIPFEVFCLRRMLRQITKRWPVRDQTRPIILQTGLRKRGRHDERFFLRSVAIQVTSFFTTTQKFLIIKKKKQTQISGTRARPSTPTTLQFSQLHIYRRRRVTCQRAKFNLKKYANKWNASD